VPTTLALQGGASSPPSRADAPARLESAADESSNRDQLYEAYNLLHTLGKNFNMPIQAPSVLVVGHQTAGKSALVEALMGFQFNHVGGGTKTRRPIALHMRYNPECMQPVCYLTNDVTGREQQMSLEEIQTFIASENHRIEVDPTRCFDHREIVVRVEYRYCPNMVMVDTPGLISAGVTHGSDEKRRPGERPSRNPHERAHAQASREAENLVLTKMKSPEYIILCIEDTTDWKHATTRSLVELADPNLSRTVLVSTKLDTKLSQFTEAEDIEDFVAGPILRKLHPHLSGGPFHTSVPCGRVGPRSTDAFNSNEAYIQSLRRREREDLNILSSMAGPQIAANLAPLVGVRRLRRFLEQRVEKCYRANVATIVPVLQQALRKTEEAQTRAHAELKALSTDSLKQAANQYREHFSKAVADCIQGTIAAAPGYFGETLEEEQMGGGSFHNPASHGATGDNGVEDNAWSELVAGQVSHAKSKLYGGSQYHRALREFAVAVEHMTLPEVTEDEIANAAGLNDVHDGTNYMRAACVIAVTKAQTSFEPLVEALQVRARHVMRRLFPIVDHILESKGITVGGVDSGGAVEVDSARASAQHAAFTEAVHQIFNDFVESALAECLTRCEDDLRGMTRFVTWDLHERGNLAVQDSLPSKEMVNIYALTMDNKRGGSRKKRGGPDERVMEEWASANGEDVVSYGYDKDEATAAKHNGRLVVGSSRAASGSSDNMDVMNLMEQVACMRDGDRTNRVVSALVQHIVRAWRMSFAQNVAMKFNCFFLLPFLEEFPFYLRQNLDKLYAGELNHMFDLSDAKVAIERRISELDAEAGANRKLQSKFEEINQQLGQAKHIYANDAEDEPLPEFENEEPLPRVSEEVGHQESGASEVEGALPISDEYYADSDVEHEDAVDEASFDEWHAANAEESAEEEEGEWWKEEE
jgi:GTPase SAR1 family protein